MELFKLLDIFFVVFHTGLILFNVFGWIWRKIRPYNLAVLLLTGSSWFILGIFYGFGYCPLTEWHWQVLEKLGKYDMPYSYIEYLLERLTGLDINPNLMDQTTLIVFFVVLVISMVLNVRDRFFKV
jgi:hypothetical protein